MITSKCLVSPKEQRLQMAMIGLMVIAVVIHFTVIQSGSHSQAVVIVHQLETAKPRPSVMTIAKGALGEQETLHIHLGLSAPKRSKSSLETAKVSSYRQSN